MNITLEYKRLQKEVNGEYPYTGEFKFVPDGEALPFIGWPFKRVIGFLSELLKKHTDVQEVTLQRIDRPGIMPMGFGPQMLQLLRTDPLAAYRALDFNTSQFSSDAGRHSTLSRSFGPTIYLRMNQGKVQCPLTGEWRHLAFGEKQGWKIRGDGDAHEKWVPLTGVIDEAPEGTQGVQRIAFSNWATADVQALLDMGAPKYFLPRAWNPNRGGWIDRHDLEALLEKNKEK